MADDGEDFDAGYVCEQSGHLRASGKGLLADGELESDAV